MRGTSGTPTPTPTRLPECRWARPPRAATCCCGQPPVLPPTYLGLPAAARECKHLLHTRCLHYLLLVPTYLPTSNWFLHASRPPTHAPACPRARSSAHAPAFLPARPYPPARRVMSNELLLIAAAMQRLGHAPGRAFVQLLADVPPMEEVAQVGGFRIQAPGVTRVYRAPPASLPQSSPMHR